MVDPAYVWPEGIPCNFDGLVRDFGSYIEQQVAKYNKEGWEEQLVDLRQHIWEKLIASDLLNKFVIRANTTLPPLMTGIQARKFLGITGKQWGYWMWKASFPDAWRGKHTSAVRRKPQRRFRQSFLPKPIKGKPNSDSALFRGVDIKALHESGAIKKRHFKSERPPVSGRGFKSYLQRAVRNHWSNWCRSHNRRHKERPLSPDLVLTQFDDGTCRATSRIEDGGSWESTLVAASYSDSELFDIRHFRRACRRARFDLSSVTAVQKGGYQKGQPTKQARRGLEVLDIVAQGYSIKEAIKKQHRAEARARVKQRG